MKRWNIVHRNQNTGGGFTLIELLAVIAIIALTAGILLPALGVAKAKALELRCASNHRQVGLAGVLYADENGDSLARNGYVEADGAEYRPLWVQGYYNHSSSPRDSTNSALMANPKYSLFARYLKEGDISVYHCPSDRTGITIGGRVYPRLRSIAMNRALGIGRDDTIHPVPRFVFVKSTDVADPVQTVHTVDVHSNTICWPFFGIVETDSFFMVPGSYHRNGSAISYTDGHVAWKQWKDARTYRPPSIRGWHGHFYPSSNNTDLAWLQSHDGSR